MNWSASGLVVGLSTFVAVLTLAARLSPARARAARTSTIGYDRSTRPTRPTRWARFRRPRPRSGPIGDVVAAAWCDDVARALRSGATLSAAIAAATTANPVMAPVIGPALSAIGRGRALAAALEGLPADPGSPAGLAISVLRTCAELGGPAAAPLERVAATLRTRAAIAEEQRAHSAQALLSARVLTTVPVALLALLALTEARVRASLGTPSGMAVVTVGAALNLVGWHWMRRIIGRPA